MMKNAIVSLVVAFGSMLSLSARSYYGTPYTFAQPDGDSVSVRLFGDDIYIHAESFDGYTLIQDPDDGFICYALTSADSSEYASSGVRYRGEDVPEAITMLVGPHVRISSESLSRKIADVKKTLGIQDEAAKPQLRAATVLPDTIYGLTVLIDFPDCQFPFTTAELDKFMNGKGSINDNQRSIKEYFQWISNGKLTYINRVPKTPYTAPNSKSYYAPSDATTYTFDRLEPVINDAINSYTKSKDGFDLSDITINKSSYYAMNIFYAGACPNKWATGLWSHKGTMMISVDNDSRLNRYVSQPYQLTHCSENLNMCSIVHESYHLLLDAPDFYPFDDHNDNTAQTFNVADEFVLRSTKNPPLTNPYILDAAGWLDNKIVLNDLKKGTKVNLEYGPGNVAVYYGNVDGDPMKERYYIEVRSFYYNTNRQVVNKPGIYIWHVYEPGDNRYSSYPDKLDCRPASSTNPFWSASSPSAVFSDDSDPSAKWINGERSGIYLSNFSEAGLKMSFCYGGDCVDEEEPEEKGEENKEENKQEVGNPQTYDKLELTNKDSLPSGKVGQKYYAKLDIVGGDGNYAIKWKDGLPAGLSMNSKFEITGTPEAAVSKYLKFILSDGTGTQTEIWLKFNIYDEKTSLDDVLETENPAVSLISLNGAFLITSGQENAMCSVYSLNGVKMDVFSVEKNGIHIFGTNYPTGVYVVDACGKRFKIIKY